MRKISMVYRGHKVFGFFHQFGVDFEEFDSGPAQLSTAIIELENGDVVTVPAGSFRFEDKQQAPA